MLDIQVASPGQVRLAGRLDAAQAERALQVLSGLPGPLTLDCSDLEYVSSAGLGVIVQTYKRLLESKSGFKLTHLSPRVRNVFTLSGLDRVIPIE
jgi:anti-sigma B factor antagonist